MVLFDTSAWIYFFRRKRKVDEHALDQVATCPPVIQEVLQGIGAQGREYDMVEQGFLALPLLDRSIPVARYVEAAELYRTGRRKGLTIRSSMDCLIAAIAIDHELPVVHQDRDFKQIEKFTPLQVISASSFF